MPHHPRRSWLLVIVTAIWAIWRLIAVSDGGLSLPEIFAAMACAGIIGVVTLFLAARVFLALLYHRRALAVALPMPLRMYIGMVLCVVGLTQTRAPLTVRLLLSQSALVEATHDIRDSAPSIRRCPPRQIGLFTVREMFVDRDEVRIYTTDCGLNLCGVVQRPWHAPVVSGRIRYTPLFGTWWHWNEKF